MSPELVVEKGLYKFKLRCVRSSFYSNFLFDVFAVSEKGISCEYKEQNTP